jgi:hypothetical protein
MKLSMLCVTQSMADRKEEVPRQQFFDRKSKEEMG